MNRLAEALEQAGALWGPCGDETCPGILMPFENDVLCSEAITDQLAHHEHGGEAG